MGGPDIDDFGISVYGREQEDSEIMSPAFVGQSIEPANMNPVGPWRDVFGADVNIVVVGFVDIDDIVFELVAGCVVVVCHI